MINLVGTSDIIRIVTSAAVALDITAQFVDHTAAAYTPGRQNTIVTTATTTTILSAPAASTQRSLKHLNMNARGGAQTVTVEYFDGTTATRIDAFSVLAGETIEYTDTVGWRVRDANGSLKMTTASTPGCFLRTTLVTATASPFVLLAATRTVRVRLGGGGGQGGGAPVNAASNASSGSGGNSGGVVDFTGAQSGSFVYAIGAAGSGAGAGLAGTAGGATTATVAGVALSASGGPGGQILATGATNGIVQPSAAVTGTGVGAQLISGKRGQVGLRVQTGAAAVTTQGVGGAGADSEFGSGGPEVQAGAAGAVAAGNAATGFGAGGGGAASGSAGAAQVGGVGVGGWMVVEEYT